MSVIVNGQAKLPHSECIKFRLLNTIYFSACPLGDQQPHKTLTLTPVKSKRISSLDRAAKNNLTAFSVYHLLVVLLTVNSVKAKGHFTCVVSVVYLLVSIQMNRHSKFLSHSIERE